MKTVVLLSLLAVIFSLTSCSSKRKRVRVPIKKQASKVVEKPIEKVVVQEKEKAVESPEMPKWSYEGANGPNKWGELSPFYIQCSEGQMQSPVDLIWKQPHQGDGISSSYKAIGYKIINDGHSIKLDVKGAGEGVVHGQTYSLEQINFHSPSEHTISGASYPLEAQFVHKNHEGELAIMAVLFVVGNENSAIKSVWANIPSGEGTANMAKGLLNPTSLLPSIKTHYRYMGSLTTPPCSEGVTWVVLNTPVEISRAQLKAFNQFYKNNNRPVQPLNERGVSNF